MTKNTILKGSAGVAAAVALAAGGVAISSGSSTKSSSAGGTFQAVPNGMPPAGARGFGAPVTGTAAAKAKAAALARYGGTVERVMQAPNGGGYEVHLFRSDGSEIHVLVSSTFQVTGTEAGGPGQGGLRPPTTQSTTGSTT